MPVIYPHDRTYPRFIGLHQIAAGDVLRIHFQVPGRPEHSVVGHVAGEPGSQFRKRHGKYMVDLQRVIGGPPMCIHTEIITSVELIAPALNGLAAS